MESGEAGAKLAFTEIFSTVGGTALMVFVVISCLGTLNGLMLGCTRGLYAIAVRNRGPKPETFSQVDRQTNMPHNSAVFGMLLCGFWLMYFFGANLSTGWFGPFCFDSSELPIVPIYAAYIPIFIMFMKKETDLGAFKRFVMPILGIAGACFMVYAAFVSHGMAVWFYLIIFAVVMIIGAAFNKEQKQK